MRVVFFGEELVQKVFLIVDSYGVEGLENWSSVRKNCDMLYFLIKHFEKLDYVSPLYEEAAVRLAEMLRKFGVKITKWDILLIFGMEK